MAEPHVDVEPEGDTEGEGDRRRAPVPPFTLVDGLDVEILLPVGDRDHLAFAGQVVALTDTTVTVALEDGPTALTVAMRPRCVIVWGADGEERAALVRNGRRVDDVRSPTTIELVLEDVRPLADVAG